MITLTTPPAINSVLGGDAPVNYDKLVIAPFTLDPKGLQIRGTLRLSSTAVPAMQEIQGSLTIDTASGVLVVEVAQLDFYRRVQLSGAQLTASKAIATDAQNALETGLVNLGLISGAQTAGV